MSAHPFDSGVATIEVRGEEYEKGNAAYYEWLTTTIEAATGEAVPWMAVELGILLDRIIRAHEAESVGGPKCAECIARDEANA